MDNKRRDEWEDNNETYSSSQVRGILNFCGIEYDSETLTHFIGFCPFHGNTDSPAFAIDKQLGKWICFNPSCCKSGTLLELIMKTKGLNYFKSVRTIKRYQDFDETSIETKIAEALTPKTFPKMSLPKVQQLHEAFWESPALDYMHSRGFNDDTLSKFKVGFSPARQYPAPYKSRPDMVVVPMFDIQSNCIGVIGRSIEGKQFKNSKGLPKSETAWNIDKARRHGSTAIILESSFDAMRVDQAGNPNAVALLGGSASPGLVEQLNRNFTTFIYMTDFDIEKTYYPNCRRCHKMCEGHRAGRDLARSLIAQLPNKSHRWAAYDDSVVFPHGAKDASDMTDEEIRQCLKNSISNLEYVQWDVERALVE